MVQELAEGHGRTRERSEVTRLMTGVAARLRRIAEIVAAALFAAMFVAFILQVFTRYVLNDPTTQT